MRRSKNISLYLTCSLFLTSCERQAKTYHAALDCKEDYSMIICDTAYTKAVIKDCNKTPTTIEQCQQQYEQCEMWRSGYAPLMKGFAVSLPDDGYPVYEQKSKKRWWGGRSWWSGRSSWDGSSWGGSWWGAKPRSGGFGKHGFSFGG